MSLINISSRKVEQQIVVQGDVLTVKNLEQSIKQADEFRKYKVGKEPHHQKQKEYWEEVYQKLIKLKP
jgi:malonyl CoA-acyl carrier protein transacylase